MVQITLRVLLRPDVQQLPKIYQTLGTDYDERVVPSIGNEVLKSIVAQFDAAELITQREVVSIMPNFSRLGTLNSLFRSLRVFARTL
jgi:prohibitin 1